MKKVFLYSVLMATLISSCSKRELQQADIENMTSKLNSGLNVPQVLADPPTLGSIAGYGKWVREGAQDQNGKITDNKPLLKVGTPNADWWDNFVEEVEYSGLDYVAMVDRGFCITRPDIDVGDPRQLSDLVDAMNRRNVNSFKIAIFDDCPAGWTAMRNVANGQGFGYSPLFDCGDTTNYQYIWDNNIKVAFQKVPDHRRFKIDGRPLIIFWGVGPAAMTNYGNGNLKKIIQHIRTNCQATFNFNPYIIIDQSWIVRDATVNDPAVVDAVHNWFIPQIAPHSWSLRAFNNVKTGCLVPAFSNSSAQHHISPANGQTLINGLTNTIGAGAKTTFIEGFTDAAEAAALWRSKDNTYYDYPNQRLNIIRRFSKTPYPPVLKVEAEGCDSFYDLTPGNSGNTFRDGDLDIVKTADLGGGWHVTNTQANEWMEWKELPLLANTKFQIRYSASTTSTVRFSVDGVNLTTITLPATGNGVWATVDAGNYTTANNSLHTVRLTILSGTPSINYFRRVSGEVGVTFYADANYGGAQSQVIPVGDYTMAQLAALGVPNDWASSVQIPPGRTLIMYSADNFSGIVWTRTSDTPNFASLVPNADNQVSSIRVQ